MKVKHWSGDIKEMTPAEAIVYEVEATSSERGQIEDLESKVQILTYMLSALVEYVGEPAAVALLETHGRYYRPVPAQRKREKPRCA